MLIEGVHFRRSWSSPADIGHKSVAVNLADVEAMGGTPVAMVISLGLPADLPVTWVKEFMTGVREEAELGGVALVGGDMTGARDISISVTVIGETAGRGGPPGTAAPSGTPVADPRLDAVLAAAMAADPDWTRLTLPIPAAGADSVTVTLDTGTGRNPRAQTRLTYDLNGAALTRASASSGPATVAEATSARIPTLASDFALRIAPSTAPVSERVRGSPPLGSSAVVGQAARWTEPSCHQDQTSSVT